MCFFLVPLRKAFYVPKCNILHVTSGNDYDVGLEAFGLMAFLLFIKSKTHLHREPVWFVPNLIIQGLLCTFISYFKKDILHVYKNTLKG